MKILAIADRQVTENLIDIIDKNSIELVILLGDLKYIDIIDLVDAKIPIVGVLGNHCSFDYLPKLSATNAHLKRISVNRTTIFGYQGCPRYKGGEFESSQEECLNKINESATPADILIAHSPATGINSAKSPHEGFDGLLWYLDSFKPKFFFHGHSYPSKEQRISRYKETIVIYVSGVEIFDLKDLGQEFPLSKPY